LSPRRPGLAEEGDVDDLLPVDRPVEGLAELGIEEHGVAHGVRRVIAVEAELVEAPVSALESGHPSGLLHGRELRLRQLDRRVDGALLEVGGHGVGALVVLEEELVDLGLAAPVVLVGDHADVLALAPLHGLEGTGADDGRLVLEGGGRRLAADLAPDVLGDDRHDHGEHVGLRLVGRDVDRVVVGGHGAGDAAGVDGQSLQVVLDDVVVGERHVLGGQRLAVLPLDALTDLERPGLAVR
jgi:hypothetical protein